MFKCLLLSVGVLAGIKLSFANRYGRCNDTYFLTKTFDCEKRFFKALATKEELRNCSELYNNEVQQCYNYTLVKCFDGVQETWRKVVKTSLYMLEGFNVAKLFCCQIISEVANQTNPKLRELLPCEDKYFQEGEHCTKKFMTMLKENRMNPLLCREFDVAVNCTFDVSRKYCTTQLELPEDVKLENPFCTADRFASLLTTTPTPYPYTSRDRKRDSTVNVQALSPAVQFGLSTHAWVMMFLSTVLIGRGFLL